MFLILGSKQNYWLSAVAAKLSDRGEQFLFLNGGDLISDLHVDDRIDAAGVSVNWNINGIQFSAHEVKGILNFLDDLSIDLFHEFAEQDQSYALCEWQAYLMFALSQFKNCANSAWGGSLSGFTNSLPFQWDLLRHESRLSLQVPRHYFGLPEDVPADVRSGLNWIVSDSPYSYRHWNTDHKLGADDRSVYLYYERPRGSAVVVSCVDDSLTATELRTQNQVPESDIQGSIRAAATYLMQYFNLQVAEMLVFVDKEQGHVTFGSIAPGLTYAGVAHNAELAIVAALSRSIGAIDPQCEN